MLIRLSLLCTVFFHLSQVFRVFSYWQALWIWSFLSWNCLPICSWQVWVFYLHSTWAGGWTLIRCTGAQQSHQYPCMAIGAAQWGKHMALDPSQAEPIAWHLSGLVNSQGQCIYLAVLLVKLLLSWLKKQLICPIIRNTSIIHFISSPWPRNMHLDIWKRWQPMGSNWRSAYVSLLASCRCFIL